MVEVKLTMVDGYTEMHYFDASNSALDVSTPLILGKDELSGFKDLVEVQVVVWETYDQYADKGVTAQFVLDDVEFVKRSCKTSY